jgi:hypothetical protein
MMIVLKNGRKLRNTVVIYRSIHTGSFTSERRWGEREFERGREGLREFESVYEDTCPTTPYAMARVIFSFPPHLDNHTTQ